VGRRIRWLGVLMTVAFALIVVQLVNIQLVRAPALSSSTFNPRVAKEKFINPRGTIYASDGTVLAKSIAPPAGTVGYPYKFTRDYPSGNVNGTTNIYSGILGYDSPLYYGTAGIEEQYDSYLKAHAQNVTSLSQIIFRQTLPPVTDDVSLTVVPKLQQAAWDALTTLPPGANKDGAVVVLNPSTGAVEAMVSNPSYSPNLMSSTSVATEKLAYFSYITKDKESIAPLSPVATQQFYAPGSTFKVVTSTAAYNLKPTLANYSYPEAQCQQFPDGGKELCDESGPCGGTMVAMLPFSCDPGYGELGVLEGQPILDKQASLFGYNSVPGLDLPGVIASQFPTIANYVPADDSLLAYSAIGQYNDRTTALQNAMVAAGIANGGAVMTPHLMSQITDSQGNVVERYTPKVASQAASSGAAEQVGLDMLGVATHGTASGVGFPAYLCVAVKTGTAQTSASQGVNTDWMIGFAPADHPTVAVAVVVPQQNVSSDGAGVAGPIMKAVLEAAIPPGSAHGCSGSPK
jgi:peptidoglycan glycosyltransferase